MSLFDVKILSQKSPRQVYCTETYKQSNMLNSGSTNGVDLGQDCCSVNNGRQEVHIFNLMVKKYGLIIKMLQV